MLLMKIMGHDRIPHYKIIYTLFSFSADPKLNRNPISIEIIILFSCNPNKTLIKVLGFVLI